MSRLGRRAVRMTVAVVVVVVIVHNPWVLIPLFLVVLPLFVAFSVVTGGVGVWRLVHYGGRSARERQRRDEREGGGVW